MNCPNCGRFMGIERVEPLRSYEDGSAYAWYCGNDECLYHDAAHGIENRSYDWLAWGISRKEMTELKPEDPETWAEFEAMRQAYLNRGKSRVAWRQSVAVRRSSNWG